MPVSDSRLSYSDCFTLFDRALDSTVGARYQVASGDHGKSRYFAMRMHMARKIDRLDNRQLHEEGTKMYGRSVYDALTVQLRPDTTGAWWVYVSHTNINPEDIEDLAEVPTAEVEERA